ncbi:MAG: hypothetical protein K2X39_01510, partial [Silvanigrellaceae bacterium]|nr:hypothetical protein [Silvanigrellaceae bacterium]
QAGAFNKEEALIRQASHFFIARNYHETISYSFVDPELQTVLYPEAADLTLLNPISPELSRMRAGLWSGLIAAMMHNFHRQQTVIKLFENGVAFDHKDGKIIETACLGGLLSGEHGSLNWSEEARKFDFFDLKGDLQAFFASLSLHNVVFEQAAHPALHPGKSAQIHINNHFAGWCGVLHPRIAAALDVTNEVLLFEVAVAPLLSAENPRYQKISKFPQIRRDLSFLVDDTITVAEIHEVVAKTVPQALLKSFDVFDVYTGKSIPERKKSLGIAVTLQEEKRTLVDQEINQIINAIIKQLGDNFAITLRD